MRLKLNNPRIIVASIIAVLCVGSSLLFPRSTIAGGQEKASGNGPVSAKLTPRLNELLTEEMLSINQAMIEIMNGFIAGEYSIVENMATQIHDSFIIKQQLTEQDKKDLMSAVPQEFLELDRAFHMTAAKLAHAAKEKDYELQRFYFGKMIESCHSCHSKYVTDKFPAFSGGTSAG